MATTCTAVFCCVLLCSALFCCVLLCAAVFCCVLLCSAVLTYISSSFSRKLLETLDTSWQHLIDLIKLYNCHHEYLFYAYEGRRRKLREDLCFTTTKHKPIKEGLSTVCLKKENARQCKRSGGGGGGRGRGGGGEVYIREEEREEDIVHDK